MIKGSHARRTNQSDPEAGQEDQAEAQRRRQFQIEDLIARTAGLPTQENSEGRGKSGGLRRKASGTGQPEQAMTACERRPHSGPCVISGAGRRIPNV